MAKNFTYPMAGELARSLPVSQAVGNPISGSYEVRSSIGLEGTFASKELAEAHAADLRAKGVKDVVVKPRVQRDIAPPPRPAGAPPMHHRPRGLPPGVPNGRATRNPPEVNEGMARAIWVTTYAQYIEELVDDTRGTERKRHGFTDRLSGINWDRTAPATPPWAYEAADWLYLEIERVNDQPMAAIVASAEQADNAAIDQRDYQYPQPGARGRRSLGVSYPRAVDWFSNGEYREETLESFGHALMMQSLGHGVSWFDDHAEFPLVVPRIDEYRFWDGNIPVVRVTPRYT